MKHTDATVSGGGTVYLVTPHTDAARNWIKENVSAESSFLGESLAVEHRYIADLVEGMRSGRIEHQMNAIRPDMAMHPLAQAAREVNAYAEKSGLKETCEHYGLAMDDVRYIAEQRALRCMWGFRGINLNLKEPTVLRLKQSEIPIYIQLCAAYMDGLVIGWRGKEFANENE